MYWSSKELLESNNLLAGWSGFELRSTPLQSKKITEYALLYSLVLRAEDYRAFLRSVAVYLPAITHEDNIIYYGRELGL